VADVVVSLKDAAGQEKFHTFRVRLTGEPPAAVAKAPDVAKPPEVKQPGAGAAWEEHTHAEGGFAARFPQPPKTAAEKIKEGMTGRADVTLPEGVRLEVSFTDMDPEVAAAGPGFFLDTMIKEMSPRKRREVRLGEHQGYEVEMQMKDETVVARLFLVKHRLYQASAVFSGGKRDDALAARFLDSFRLLESQPAPNKKGPDKADTPPPKTVGKLTWTEHQHPEGRYAVKLPAEPKFEVRPGKFGLTGGFKLLGPNGMTFNVNFIDHAAAILDPVLNTQPFGRAKESKVIEVEGNRAVDALLEGYNQDRPLIAMRCFYIKKRFFTIWAEGKPESFDQEAARLFLESFHTIAGPSLDLPKTDPVVALKVPRPITVKDTGGLPSIAFSPKGDLLAVGTREGRVHLYDFPGMNQIAALDGARKPGGFGKDIHQLSFTADGQFLAAACGAENTVRVFDVAGRQSRNLLIVGEQANGAVFLADGKTLAVAVDREPAVKLWDAFENRPPQALKGHEFEPRCLAASADGKSVASAGADRKVIVWNVAKRKPSRQFETEDFGTYLSLAFAPNGKLLAAGDSSKKLRVYNLLEASVLYDLEGHGNDVTCVAFSPKDALLASGSSDKTLRLWGLASGKQLHVELLDDRVQAVAFSPDGRYLVATGNDAVVQVWDLKK
jgi:hypothetical protein